jgi:hypothetical protein
MKEMEPIVIPIYAVIARRMIGSAVVCHRYVFPLVCQICQFSLLTLALLRMNHSEYLPLIQNVIIFFTPETPS